MRKNRRGAARTKRSLAARPTERAGEISRFAALQQHHDDQHQAIEHEKGRQKYPPQESEIQDK